MISIGSVRSTVSNTIYGQLKKRRLKIVYQKVFVEFECGRELRHDLMDSIQPLKEDGTPFVWIFLRAVSTAVRKLVSKLKPLALDQHVESLERAECLELWKYFVISN